MKNWLKGKSLDDQHFILWIAAFVIANLVFALWRPDFDISETRSFDTFILHFVYVGGGTWLAKKLLDSIFDIKKKDS